MAHRLKWHAIQARFQRLQHEVEEAIGEGALPDDFRELTATLQKIAPRLTNSELSTFIDFLLVYLHMMKTERKHVQLDTLHYLLYGTPYDPTDEHGEPRSHPT